MLTIKQTQMERLGASLGGDGIPLVQPCTGQVAAPNVGNSLPAPSIPNAKDTTSSDDPTVDPLIEKSPTLKKQLDDLKKDGWTIQYWDGPGSDCNKNGKVIRVDKASKGNSKDVVQTLAHEAGHAFHKLKVDSSSKEAYVNSYLQDEGAATLNNIKVQREIIDNGGGDIKIAGQPSNAEKYNSAYDEYLKDKDLDKAQKAMGSVFGNGETTSTTGETYSDYYGSYYDRKNKKK